MAGMMQNQVADDNSWKTQNFRQNMVAKIEEAILHCAAPTSKNAAEMENQVYSKANSKNEYLSFVARLILHIKEMGNKGKPPGSQPNLMSGGINVLHNQITQLNSMGQIGGGGMNQGQQQIGQGLGQQGQQGGGGMAMPQGAMNMPQQGGGGGMGGLNQQGGMMGQQGGMIGQQGGMIGQQGGMLGQQGGGMMGLQGGQGGMMGQQQVRIIAPGQGGGGTMLGQQGPMMMQQSGAGGMNVNMGQQGQQQNAQQMQIGQQQAQGQMINPNFMNQQQMQTGMGQGPMQGNPGGMNNPQIQQQLQNAQMQQQLHQQPQQGDQQTVGVSIGVGRGMRMPLQQMSHMPRKALQHTRPMNPSIGGISRAEHGSNYPMNRLIYFGSQQAEGVGGGMSSQFQGTGQQGQRTGGPFLPPNPSPGMPLGVPTPSPNSINVQGSMQSGFANSPQPLHPHGSPAPQQSGGIRPFLNQMVPSPNMNVSTPMPMAPTPSPRNQEELACMKKIEDLRRYTDMIQRMIVKIGNEDAEKSSKMKKLLDILMNPTRQVSMDILLKCEAALRKMERQQHETGPASQPTMPPKDQISPFLQIQEAILTTMKNGSASHTFLRTFRPSIEALTGQSAVGPDIPDEECATDEEPKPEISSVLRRELKMLGRRFPITIKPRGRKLPMQLNASIGDPNLPRVPLLKMIIPVDYPEESPILIDFKKDYSFTPFLSSISQAFKSRKVLLPTKFSVYELLISWEMSIRQVSNPISKKKPLKRLSSLPNPRPIQPSSGRLALSFL